MPLAAGQTLSFYEILGPLGAGGMGQVYRARDTRLDREVAIKVLPEELAADEDRLRRFEREAKTLASLNHPNVAQVYGMDQVGDTCFIAMELVPGQDLAQRLSRGPLLVEEAIDVCRQIAEGLEAAHEAGVVHRDLKPANVRVTPDGLVKILDFGLAKPVRPRTAGDGRSTAETNSFLVTEEGLVLGTPTYMSPEQARGKPVDRRTDIWALGCVLYECLTGERAFQRASLTDVLAAIVSEEPDWSRVPEVPARVLELLRRALTKDPKLRLRDAGEARVQLALAANEPAATTATRTRPLRGLALAVAAVVATVAFWIGTRFGRGDGTPDLARPAIRAVVHEFEEDEAPGRVAISPDGKHIAWTDVEGLHVRDLADPTSRTILAKRREQWRELGWSPDSRELVYLDDKGIWRINVENEATSRITDFDGVPWTTLEWTEDGRIVYIAVDGIAAVTLGGERELWIELPDEIQHFDSFLLVPGRRAALAQPHDSEEFELFTPGGRRAVPGLSGEPVFLTRDGTLLAKQGIQGPLTAVPFSLDALEIHGEPRIVLADCTDASVADEGTLAYRVVEGELGSTLVTIGRSEGSVTAIGRRHETIWGGALSPDGQKVVFCVIGPAACETWVHDFQRNMSTSWFSRDDGAAVPFFLPDGRIAVIPLFPVHGTFVYPASGRGMPERLEGATVGISRDGASRVFVEDAETFFGAGGATILASPDEGRQVLFDGGERETFIRFSWDGRWMLHSSERTRTRQVFLTRFPPTEEEWRVSADGGDDAWFAADGSEILFEHQHRVYRVTFETEPEVRLGAPEVLFEVTPDTTLADYDGKGRFVGSQDAASGRTWVYVDTRGL